MRKKIVLGILLFIIALAGMGLYLDYLYAVVVNDRYEYSEDSIFVINTYEDNRSVWLKFWHDDSSLYGAAISAIDENGNVQNVISMKDVLIADAYYSNEHIYVLYYKAADIYINDIVEACYLADFPLSDPNEYTITEYRNGEVVDWNKDTAEVIKRTDLVLQNGLASNVAQINGTWYYVDGKELVRMVNGTCETIFSFEDDLNGADVFQTDELLYVIANDGDKTSRVHIINLQTFSNSIYYETAEELVDCAVVGTDLYILHPQSVIRIDSTGEKQKIFELDSNTSESLSALFTDTDNHVILLSNREIRIFDKNGQIMHSKGYNNGVSIQMKVEE